MSYPSPLTILTGSSRGMGEAMAAQCLNEGHCVIGISRQPSEALDALAASRGATLLQWRHDLAEPEAAGWALLEWLQAQAPGRFSQATLINNAGVIAPLQPLADIDPAATAKVLRVGLEAAMVLSTLFLRGTRGWTVPRKLLNISSGLGRRAMAGSASYCAAKAGMDHFSRALALEEALQPSGAKVVSLAPGVIDTGMQDQLRAADPAAFPDHANFVALKAGGQLLSPADAAARVLAFLARPDFGSNPVADVREASA
ncbi:MAG TPA: SDR family NAD(P)-dependent oxidoreductase [Ideonella sp.]|uniref:SDR family NAD(P)-dependent oxidoreductase n=1 Tax=Ideonella sp. TaxID=1929293 RepID=UPI002C4A253C|nr:SDR family NAD(P)-dependent oxidoreductase [Ideonella sp.]HSI47046.1 SDR family NAD(P)-dependent oxidoreductase [Ideonella sp.]